LAFPEKDNSGNDAVGYAAVKTVDEYAAIIGRDKTWVGDTFISCFAKSANCTVIRFVQASRSWGAHTDIV
jgi:hypothetical protein